MDLELIGSAFQLDPKINRLLTLPNGVETVNPTSFELKWEWI